MQTQDRGIFAPNASTETWDDRFFTNMVMLIVLLMITLWLLW
jgi:competence protein ComGC